MFDTSKVKRILWLQTLGWILVPAFARAAESGGSSFTALEDYFELVKEATNKDNSDRAFTELQRRARDEYKESTPKKSELAKAKKEYERAKALTAFTNYYLTTSNARKALAGISEAGLVESGKEQDWAKAITQGQYKVALQEKIKTVMAAPSGTDPVEYISLGGTGKDAFGSTLIAVQKKNADEVELKVALDLSPDAKKNPNYVKAKNAGLTDADLENLVRGNVSKSLAEETKIPAKVDPKTGILVDEPSITKELAQKATDKLTKESLDTLDDSVLSYLKEDIADKEDEAKDKANPVKDTTEAKLLAAKQAMADFVKANPDTIKDGKDMCAVLRQMGYSPEKLPKLVAENCEIQPIVLAKDVAAAEPEAKKDKAKDDQETAAEGKRFAADAINLENRCRARLLQLGALPTSGMNSFYGPLGDITGMLNSYTNMPDMIDVKNRADQEGGANNPTLDINALTSFATAVVKKRYAGGGSDVGDKLTDAEGTSARILQKYERDLNTLELAERAKLAQQMGIRPDDLFNIAITQQLQNNGLVREMRYYRNMAAAVHTAVLNQMNLLRGSNPFSLATQAGATGQGQTNGNLGLTGVNVNGANSLGNVPVVGNPAVRAPSTTGLPIGGQVPMNRAPNGVSMPFGGSQGVVRPK